MKGESKKGKKRVKKGEKEERGGEGGGEEAKEGRRKKQRKKLIYKAWLYPIPDVCYYLYPEIHTVFPYDFSKRRPWMFSEDLLLP